MKVQVIMFDNTSNVKRVQTEDGKPIEYEVLHEEDTPDNDEAYDCWGDKIIEEDSDGKNN